MPQHLLLMVSFSSLQFTSLHHLITPRHRWEEGVVNSLYSLVSSLSLPQVWVSLVSFVVGLVLEGGVAIIGLLAMECVPDQLSGSAHGLACAVAQCKLITMGRD